MKLTFYKTLLAPLLTVTLCGCQNSSPTATSATRHHTISTHVVNNGAPVSLAPAAGPTQIEQAIGGDPNSAQLQSISGALLEFYAYHGSLPPSLEALRFLPDLEQPLDLVSPASGQPYAYVPAGLRSAIDNRAVVVYDPIPDAAGLRDVILFRPPVARENGEAVVVRMPQAEFAQYVR